MHLAKAECMRQRRWTKESVRFTRALMSQNLSDTLMDLASELTVGRWQPAVNGRAPRPGCLFQLCKAGEMMSSFLQRLIGTAAAPKAGPESQSLNDSEHSTQKEGPAQLAGQLRAASPFPAAYLQEEEVDIPKLISVFKQALFDLEVLDEAVLMVMGSGARVWLRIEKRAILHSISYSFKPESSRLDRLEMANRCNLTTMGQFSVGGERLFAESRYSFVDGLSPKGLVQHLRNFEHATSSAVSALDHDGIVL